MKNFKLKWDPINWPLVIWTLFFGLILFGGFHIYYIAPFQVWMLGAGVVVLVIMIVAGVLQADEHEHHCDHDRHHDHHDEEHCHHEEPHQPVSRHERNFLHLIPLLLFMWVGPQALGVQAISGKSPFMAPRLGSAQPGLADDLDAYEGYYPTNLFALYNIPEFAEKEQQVEITGRVYHPKPYDVPDELKPHDVKTLLFHFTIVCCAADARPLSVVIKGKDISDIEDGAWLKIQGKVKRIPGSRILALFADQAERTGSPEDPYLRMR
jgi:uncharacterized repeat protein (TIGR03943 family)